MPSSSQTPSQSPSPRPPSQTRPASKKTTRQRRPSLKAPAKPWYEKWFDSHYLDLYAHRDNPDAERQFDLIEKTLNLSADQGDLPHNKKSSAPRILDAGCGYGRHVALFAKRGYACHGIDLSRTLIRYGKKLDPSRSIREGDLCNLENMYPHKSFTLITSLFTSLGYFRSRREHTEVLRSMHTVLAPDGWLWIDFLNPAFVRATLKPTSHKQIPDTNFPGETKHFYEKRRIAGGRVIKDIVVEYIPVSRTKKATPTTPASTSTPAPAKVVEHYQESVALYTLEDWMSMTKAAGFAARAIFGDYHGRALTPKSPRMILVVQKVT